MELLVERDFDRLEDLFGMSQANFETGTASERDALTLYDVFASSDDTLAPLIEEWNNAVPDSPFAPLARALYYENRGWSARGGAFYNETADSRLARMNEPFAIARENAVIAIQRNNQQSLAYAILINIGKAYGATWTEEVMLAGLEAVPSSLRIRWAYLDSLTPWWGGSLDRIRAFIDAHVRTAPNQDELEGYFGFADYATGEVWRRKGRPAEALSYFDRALEHGEIAIYLEMRARAHKALKNYEEALADYSRILEFAPDYIDVLNARGTLYFWNLNNPEAAFADLTKAVELDPLNPDLRLRRGKAYFLSRRFDEALADLNVALELGSGDYRIHKLRGRILFFGNMDLEEANEEFRLATEINPEHNYNWYFYARSLEQLKDCESVTAYKRFLAMCEAGDRCGVDYITYSQERVDLLQPWCLDK